MKKLLFAIAAVAVTMTSCSKDETDDLTKNENPVITFTSLTGTTVEAGSTLSLVISVRANDDGDKLKTVTLADGEGNPIGNPFVDINETSFDTTITLISSTTFETSTFTVVASDKNDHLAAKSLTITTVSGFDSEGLTGQIHHIFGALNGSYDLVNDAEVAAAANDSLKDMSNTEVNDATFTGSWTAKNDTKFVRASTVDFSTATYSSIVSTYASLSAATDPSLGFPNANEVIIAKLRGGEDYVLIKITSVDPTFEDGGAAGDNGKLSFEYKK
jgi:hypothetical protein